MDGRTLAAINRFWPNFSRRIRKSPGCWEWTGQRDANGYGKVKHLGVTHRAHRLMARLEGFDVDGFVMHKCDNRLCVRPDHLRLGTHDENMADMKIKGRAATGARHATRLYDGLNRHERNGRSKLSWQDVDAIRARFAAGGVTKAQLAREYGVTDVMVGNIVRGTHWVGERVHAGA